MTRRRNRSKRTGAALLSLKEIFLGQSDVSSGIEIWTHWKAEAGVVVADRAQPLSFRNGTLWVVVPSAAWLQELQFQAELIRNNLNRACGRPIIKEIRFQQGDFPLQETVSTHSSAPPESCPLPDPETTEQIHAQVRRIRDPEMREQVRRLWMLSASRKLE